MIDAEVVKRSLHEKVEIIPCEIHQTSHNTGKHQTPEIPNSTFGRAFEGELNGAYIRLATRFLETQPNDDKLITLANMCQR